ncbi:hypothetical protein E3N88_11702 [Mikania micrantha]|uniref:Cytochrome P450 n=1 Tax=Mikania micrantha TaxID=192012 RepID=A0A5N6P5G2_9ASTR|nr:hypothetical protein E3N88_11702 [Mikania micrantha]
MSLRFGFNSVVVISSASLAKEVMKTQDLSFCDRPSSVIGQQKLSYGGLDIAFSPYNEHWREMRKIFVLHLFSPKRVQSFRRIREDEISSMLKTIRDSALSNDVVNLSELMKNVTNNVTMRVSFGDRYQDLCEKTKVYQLLDELQPHFVNLLVSDQLIDEHLMINNQKHKAYHEDEDNFIDVLLQLGKDKVFSCTHDHIKAMLMPSALAGLTFHSLTVSMFDGKNVLVGGTDTSAASVVWAMASMVKNPEAMKKAQEEVRNVIGKNGKLDEDDHLPKLTYLKAVIKETLRLYPPAPLLMPRETRKDVVLQGYNIKQKTFVYVNAWAIGRDPKSWDNPEEFLPERFVDGSCDIDFKGNDFELIPFGSGRRICPGMSAGVLMMEVLLANLLYLFDWGLPNGVTKEDIDFDAKPGITMHKRNELCMLAHVNI